MSNGWVKLHRSIMDNPLYFDKPFCRSMAWIDLLLSANHEEREIFFNGNILTVRRGSFITSYDKISDRWGWSSTKVRKFFNTLIKQEMIQVKSDEKKTVVSLVNYTFYQGGEHTENIQKTYREHTEVIQKNTNKNEKNDNNEKNDIDSDLKNEIYNRASLKNIQEIIIMKHAVYRFINILSKDEIFDSIDRSEGKHSNYLITVLETKVRDKQKPKPQTPIKPVSSKTDKPKLTMSAEPEFEPLSENDLNELYQLAIRLDNKE